MCATVNLLIDIEIWPSYSYNPVLQKRLSFLGFLIYFDKNEVSTLNRKKFKTSTFEVGNWITERNEFNGTSQIEIKWNPSPLDLK